MADDFELPHNFATNASQAVDVILTQEAGRIGSDIHKATLHTSPWIDLIKPSTFPEGMGYQLSTLIYDRALPLTPTNVDLYSGGNDHRSRGILVCSRIHARHRPEWLQRKPAGSNPLYRD